MEYGRILVVTVSMIAAMLGVVVLRRYVPLEQLKENNEFAGFTLAVVGAVYGVYLAFTVVVAWEQFRGADINATAEAVHLSEVWRDVQVLAPDARDKVQERLLAYAASVIDLEWAAMAAGSGSSDAETSRIYEDLWRSIYAARASVTSPADLSFFSEAVAQMNQLGMNRRLRLLSSQAALPDIMWVLLIGGGVVTVLITYIIGTRHLWVQGAVTAAITGLLVFSLLLVGALQHPFSGRVSVRPNAFESVRKSFGDRRQIQRSLEGRDRQQQAKP